MPRTLPAKVVVHASNALVTLSQTPISGGPQMRIGPDGQPVWAPGARPTPGQMYRVARAIGDGLAALEAIIGPLAKAEADLMERHAAPAPSTEAQGPPPKPGSKAEKAAKVAQAKAAEEAKAREALVLAEREELFEVPVEVPERLTLDWDALQEHEGLNYAVVDALGRVFGPPD